MALREALQKKLIFVSGKGGVGKTSVSQASALALSSKGLKTLWVTFEDPTLPAGDTQELSSTLHHLNCDANRAFEEYATMKIGVAGLAKLFVQNKLMRYLSQAAPGMHDLVLLGKVWHEANSYDRVVVDMPSTGYGLTMFQATRNFARLFKGGPIHRDADAMLETFGDSARTAHIVLALPEEMPLQEGVELMGFLRDLFPANAAHAVCNRLWPAPAGTLVESPQANTLLVTNPSEYVRGRLELERSNLALWKDLAFDRIDYLSPNAPLVEQLSQKLGAFL